MAPRGLIPFNYFRRPPPVATTGAFRLHAILTIRGKGSLGGGKCLGSSLAGNYRISLVLEHTPDNNDHLSDS